jgi:hypothetical protein
LRFIFLTLFNIIVGLLSGSSEFLSFSSGSVYGKI